MQFTILDYEHKYDPDNPAGIYAYVDKNSPIEIQFGYELPDGSVEWLKPDNYVLNAKPSAQNNQATFNGTGLIGESDRDFLQEQAGFQEPLRHGRRGAFGRRIDPDGAGDKSLGD